MDRSRSPLRVDSNGRRRDNNKSQDSGKSSDNITNVMNPMMMANMYPQGNYVLVFCFISNTYVYPYISGRKLLYKCSKI